jgi:Asp-tRNA(Asn)/Glu-tRNA(Gln) amidotransferase A subunit family amidase
MELVDLTLTEAREALVRKDFSSVEYTQALLKRTAQAQALNAYITHDGQALLAASAQADAQGASTNEAMALGGVPMALKDNINTRTLPTSGGTRALLGRIPPTDAPVAQALWKAGALLAGKANMHELAFGITNNNAVTGASRNPWNTQRIPGGSSGGAAAAVAARMVPGALGTDTGASVRLPAALCGIVGFRPTVGRYNNSGVLPISHTRDTVGPLARSVQDVRLIDAVLVGTHAPPQKLSLRGVRLGVPRSTCFAGAQNGVLLVIERALARLQQQGIELVEVDMASMMPLNEAVGFPVALYEFVQDVPAYLAACGYGLSLQDVARQIGSPDVAGIVASQLGNQAMPAQAYQAALQARVRLQAAYQDLFSHHRISALAFPTSVLTARPIGDDETVDIDGVRLPTFGCYIRNTDPGSNAGIPGISLPAGLANDGLPVGLELDGPVGADETLLALAQAIEQAMDPMPAANAWRT